MAYIHEIPEWPHFRWNLAHLAPRLAEVRYRQGRLIGRLKSFGVDLRAEANLQTLTEDVVTSSAIEGDVLDRDQVRSSLARRLGMDIGGLVPSDRDVEGMVEMTLDATRNHAAPLTADRLWAWHSALFPTARSGLAKITVGAWRAQGSDPMQVVSGSFGREKVHFEAPSAARLDAEMTGFLNWFEMPAELDPVMKAALAHLWFVTVHPFEDGNGRIARAVADLALARSDGCHERVYSMSAQIRLERRGYYDILERTQKGDLDITPWLQWFFDSLQRAFEGAERIVGSVFRKARFWELHRSDQLNERQRKVVNRLLDGFEGKMTSSKWASLTKTSHDTAGRDLVDLVTRGVLVRNPGGGRSTSYSLVEIA